MSKLIIRPAELTDVPTIMQFIIDLAVYEKAVEEVVSNEEHIIKALFCEQARAFGLIAEVDGTAVGFAVYFYNYSTWLGKHGIYLEDLYVTPDSRGLGAGKALLQRLAQLAVENDCHRLEWSVLDWNEPAIQFYKAMGAVAMDEWTVYRLTGKALKQFASDDASTLD